MNIHDDGRGTVLNNLSIYFKVKLIYQGAMLLKTVIPVVKNWQGLNDGSKVEAIVCGFVT